MAVRHDSLLHRLVPPNPPGTARGAGSVGQVAQRESVLQELDGQYDPVGVAERQ